MTLIQAVVIQNPDLNLRCGFCLAVLEPEVLRFETQLFHQDCWLKLVQFRGVSEAELICLDGTAKVLPTGFIARPSPA